MIRLILGYWNHYRLWKKFQDVGVCPLFLGRFLEDLKSYSSPQDWWKHTSNSSLLLQYVLEYAVVSAELKQKAHFLYFQDYTPERVLLELRALIPGFPELASNSNRGENYVYSKTRRVVCWLQSKPCQFCCEVVFHLHGRLFVARQSNALEFLESTWESATWQDGYTLGYDRLSVVPVRYICLADSDSCFVASKGSPASIQPATLTLKQEVFPNTKVNQKRFIHLSRLSRSLEEDHRRVREKSSQLRSLCRELETVEQK